MCDKSCKIVKFKMCIKKKQVVNSEFQFRGKVTLYIIATIHPHYKFSQPSSNHVTSASLKPLPRVVKPTALWQFTSRSFPIHSHLSNDHL